MTAVDTLGGDPWLSAAEGTEESETCIDATEGRESAGGIASSWDDGDSLMDPEDTLLPVF
jgi:hypothetical protein